jgi:hypothetical protein
MKISRAIVVSTIARVFYCLPSYGMAIGMT